MHLEEFFERRVMGLGTVGSTLTFKDDKLTKVTFCPGHVGIAVLKNGVLWAPLNLKRCLFGASILLFDESFLEWRRQIAHCPKIWSCVSEFEIKVMLIYSHRIFLFSLFSFLSFFLLFPRCCCYLAFLGLTLHPLSSSPFLHSSVYFLHLYNLIFFLYLRCLPFLSSSLHHYSLHHLPHTLTLLSSRLWLNSHTFEPFETLPWSLQAFTLLTSLFLLPFGA